MSEEGNMDQKFKRFKIISWLLCMYQLLLHAFFKWISNTHFYLFLPFPIYLIIYSCMHAVAGLAIIGTI